MAATIEAASPGGLAPAYLDQLDAARRTRETYARALRQWAAWTAAEGVADTQATRATVVGFKRHLESAGKSPHTVNSYLSAVRSMYAWADAAGIYPNIAAGVKGERTEPGGAKDSLTLDQARRLLSYREPGSPTDARDAAIVSLMLRRGLRSCEIARADAGDVRNTGAGAILLVHGKGRAGKGQFVVLGDACSRAVGDYMATRHGAGPDDPLFAGAGNRNAGGRLTARTVGRIVARRMRACGIAGPSLSPHSLRHTAVTFALLGGATVQEAQGMARHASIETTMVYAHNIDRMRGAAEAAADLYIDGRTQENTRRTRRLTGALLISDADENTAGRSLCYSENTGEHAEARFAARENTAGTRYLAGVSSESRQSENTGGTGYGTRREHTENTAGQDGGTEDDR